jgi:hypothetical protein
MGILLFVLKAVGITADMLTVGETLKRNFQTTQSFEKVLGKSIGLAFQEEKAKIKEFSPSKNAHFDEKRFVELLMKLDGKDIENNEALIKDLIKIISEIVFIDGFKDKSNKDLVRIIEVIAKRGVEKFWVLINNYESLVNEILISNTLESKENIKGLLESQKIQGEAIDEVKELLRKISFMSADVGLPSFNAETETATPSVQKFDGKSFTNPFALVRAEDFNHNYSKLANLFQNIADWDAVQSRTNNVFIVGGRGTGKSMILRRMSIQTTISDYHNNGKKDIKLSEINEDYYGIYIKLIRGTFDQYENNSTIPQNQSNFLAQHELNIKIIDSFRDSISWLINKTTLVFTESELKALVNDLSRLFSQNTICNSFAELDQLIKNEQKAIHQYFKNKTFEIEEKYSGNASESAFFVTELSQVFRKYFCNFGKDFRLILLIDEYEALAEIQQKAINNIIKNRLPDLTIKLAMRKDSIKSRDTFTAGEPIQEPRDYNTFNIDYEIGEEKNYIELLKGICAKRLKNSEYSEQSIEKYLVETPSEFFYDEQKISDELDKLWHSGNRKSDQPNQEFFKKYNLTAIHRVYSRKDSKFPYYGFEQYKFLSNGIISNFLELCKYTFYFALTKEQNLNTTPAINPKIQSHSVYYVSEKLFNQIDSNVPEVGPILKRFLTDLGSVIRTKLLKHTSETECNKVAVLNYDEYGYRFKLLSKVIKKANTWSVINYIKADESMETKNETTQKTDEIIINRIYCPHLSIPASGRWTVRIRAEDLEGLLGDKSSKSFKKIINDIIPSTVNIEDLDSLTLFNDDASKN